MDLVLASSICSKPVTTVFLHLRSYRKTRGVDFGLLTQPELLLDEESHNGDDASGDCRLRYQQSIVDVYARFCVPDRAGKQFLIHRKAMFRITDVVIDKLRVADSSIATLEGSIVQGVQGGRTEMQVGSVIERRGLDMKLMLLR